MVKANRRRVGEESEPAGHATAARNNLSKRLKTFLLQQSKLSAAHLRAVQAKDLATARQLDGPLSEASNGMHLYAKMLRDHQLSHECPRLRPLLRDGHNRIVEEMLVLCPTDS